MHCRQTLEVDLQSTAERRVECVAGAPEGVASILWPGDDFQRCGARGLLFIGDVCVPQLDLGEGGRVGTARFVVVNH